MKSTATTRMGLLLGQDCQDVFLFPSTARKLRVRWVAHCRQMSETLCHYGGSDFSLLSWRYFYHNIYCALLCESPQNLSENHRIFLRPSRLPSPVSSPIASLPPFILCFYRQVCLVYTSINIFIHICNHEGGRAIQSVFAVSVVCV